MKILKWLLSPAQEESPVQEVPLQPSYKPAKRVPSPPPVPSQPQPALSPKPASPEGEKLFAYHFPSQFTTSGVDKLPDYTPVPWSSKEVEIIDSKNTAEKAFDFVMDKLDENFNIKLNKPYEFIFVPSNDTSVLKGSVAGTDGPEFQEQSIQVAGCISDKENKGYKFYLLEGLEKHEAYSHLAAIIANAWMNECVPSARRGTVGQPFMKWIQYKFSYKIKDYYNARSVKEGQDANAVESMLKIEEEHGERGVFEEVLGKTNYYKQIEGQ